MKAIGAVRLSLNWSESIEVGAAQAWEGRRELWKWLVNNVPLKISQQVILHHHQDGLTGLCRNSIAFCRAGNIVFFPFLGIPDLEKEKKNTLMLGTRERGIIKKWFSKNNLQRLPFYSDMPALMSIPDTHKRNNIISLLLLTLSEAIHFVSLMWSYQWSRLASLWWSLVSTIQIFTYGWDKCEQSPHFPRWKGKRGRVRRGCHTVLLSWKSKRKKDCNALLWSYPFLKANGHWTRLANWT